MILRNREMRRKGYGASVGSKNLANYIKKDHNGQMKEGDLFGFVERLVPLTTRDRSRVVKLLRTLIAFVMENYTVSDWKLSSVSELGTLWCYEELKASIEDMEKDKGKTITVKMFELYQDTWKPEKHYHIITQRIENLIKQYLLMEV